MAKNLQRQHAKAVQRKRALQERRRVEAAEGSGPLARQVLRAAAAPVHACLVQDTVFEAGVGMVLLIRKTGARSFAVGGFLVDAYCLGVKDAMFRELDEDGLETLLAGVGSTGRLDPVDLSHARKLVRDAVAYARGLGLSPHPDTATVEALFGDADPDACDVVFAFGHEGRPFYVPGPKETPTQIRRRLEQLRRTLGPAGFDFGMPLDEDEALEGPDDDDDEDIEAEGAYDPHVAPDPAEWLALDEGARIARARNFHHRAGVAVPNENLHATFHVMIENQIAMGDELPVRRTVGRLMAEGLDRHEAVHALAALLSDYMNRSLKNPGAHPNPTEAYSKAVERYTAADWRRQYGGKA